MHHHKTYTPYRRALAWVGFVTLYLLAPLALIIGISALNTQAHAAADDAHAQYCALASSPCGLR